MYCEETLKIDMRLAAIVSDVEGRIAVGQLGEHRYRRPMGIVCPSVCLTSSSTSVWVVCASTVRQHKRTIKSRKGFMNNDQKWCLLVTGIQVGVRNGVVGVYFQRGEWQQNGAIGYLLQMK